MPHVDSEHGLRVQLATALRELEEEKALAMRVGDRAWAAEAERDDLRALLRGCRPLVAKAHIEADEGTEEGWFDFLRRIDAALVDGGEG